MGETAQRRGFGFSEACEMSNATEKSASDYFETVRPKEILSNEAKIDHEDASSSGGRGREETDEECAKRRKFMRKEDDVPELLGENDSDVEQEAEEGRVPKAKRAPRNRQMKKSAYTR